MVLGVDDGPDLFPEAEPSPEIRIFHEPLVGVPVGSIAAATALTAKVMDGGNRGEERLPRGTPGSNSGGRVYRPSMSILGRLAVLFVIVPLLELALLIQIGQVVGFWPTIGLVVLTGVTGAWLARVEGLRTWWRLREDLARGRLPGQAIMDGVAILIGGAFLLTPGILTDLCGFALLLPPTRRALQKRVRRALEERIRDGTIQMTVLHSQPWATPPADSPWEGSPDDPV